MKNRKILISILSLVLLVGIIVGAMCMNVAAASAVTENSWISKPEKTLVKCPGGNCDHTTCDYVYSFAVIGDTQNLNIIDAADKEHEYMKDLYQWIVDREETYNIQYVLGLGDITQSYYQGYNDSKYGLGTTAFKLEWENAKAALAVLDGKVPYSLVRGNHDVSSYFNGVFGKGNQYYTDLSALAEKNDDEGRPMAGFFNADKIEDTYRKIIIGDDKYIIFTLDWFQFSRETDCIEGTCAEDCEIHNCLGWVDDVLTENSDYTAIITTHDFLYRDGSMSDDFDETYPHENLTGSRPNWEEVSSTGGNASPKYLWNVLRKHENVQMILCGHVDEDDIEVTQFCGDNGNTVTCMLIDAQTIDQTIEPVGMVAMFYVAADGKVMNVEYISTVRDLADGNKPSYLGAQNQFEITLDYSVSDTNSGWTKTTYGDIITEIYEKHHFHILVDDDSDVSTNAMYLSSHDSWEETLTEVHTYSASSIHGNDTKRKQKTYYIVMAEDYTDNYNGLHNSRSTYNFSRTVIDLNGKTLTLASTASGNNVFLPFYTVSASRTPNYTIINGYINITGSASLAITKTNNYGDGGVATLELNNVDITYNTPDGVSAKPLVINESGSKGYSARLNLNINDCDIDFSKVSSAFTLFNFNDTYNNTNVSLTVKGGSVKGSTVANTKFVEQNWPGDSVTFIPDEGGNYTAFTYNDSTKPSGVFYSETEGSTLEFGSPAAKDGAYVSTLINSSAVLTKYGAIPTDKQNDTFVIFKNGEALYSVSNWNTLINTAIKGNKNYQSGCTVLVRKDYNTTDAGYSPSWFAYIDDITIDLDGHTITRGKYHFLQPYGTEPTAHETTIRVKNGWIKSSADADTAPIAYNDANTNTAKDTINFIFDNVNIDIRDYTNNAQGVIAVFAGKVGYSGVKSSVTFNDCVFYPKKSGDTVLFNLNENNDNKTDVEVTINGGQIIADTLAGLTLAEFSAEREAGAGSPDSLLFGEKAVTVRLPKNYTVPEGQYYELTQGTYALTQTSTDEDYAYYTFEMVVETVIPTEYGDIPFNWSNVDKYPFVVFKNGVAVHAFSDWGTFINEDVYKNTDYQSGCTVLLRRNYITGTDSTVAPKYFHVIDDMIIDLGKNVFERGSVHMFQLIGYDDGNNIANTVNITIKNGTVKSAGSLAPICFNDNSGNNTRDSFNITCEGVTFNVSVNTTGIVTCFKDGNKGSVNTVTFKDCTISRGDSTSTQTLFSLAESPKTTGGTPENKIDVHIVIDGGSFTASTLKGLTFAGFSTERESGNGSPDKITFKNSFTVKLPLNYEVPETTFASITDYYFIKTSEDASYTYYTFTTEAPELDEPEPDNSVETQYGTITSDKANADNYPLVLFEGNAADGYTMVYASSDIAVIYSKIADALGKDYIILVRADYTKTTNQYIKNFTGSLTIDLDGNTLSINNGGNYLLDLGVETANAPKGTFNIKNGTLIKIGGRGVVCMNYNANLKTNDAEYTFNFSDVTFRSTDSSYNKNVIFTTWENGYDSAEAKIVMNSTFEDCTFDFVNSISGAVMLDLGHSERVKDRVQHNVVIKGGIILANTAADINNNFTKLDGDTNGRADSLKFAANANGEYVTLVLPNTVDGADVTSTWTIADDANCTFIKTSENGNDNVYELVCKTVYGNIPADCVDASKNPIIIFKADKTFVGSYTTLPSAFAAAGLVSGGSGSAVDGADAVILFRNNFDITDVSNLTNNVTGYKNNVVIDFNGFTLNCSIVGSNASILTLTNSASTDEDKTYGTITFMNGAICYTAGNNSSSVIRANGAEGIYTINFENVTLSTTNSTATSKIYFVISTAGSSKAAQVINSTFTNCVFDYTKAQKYTYAFGSGGGAAINAVLVNCDVLAGSNNALPFVDTAHNKQALAYYANYGTTSNDTLTVVESINFVLNNGISAPTATHTIGGVEGVFIKASVNDTTTTYKFVPKTLLSFAPMSSITLGSELVYNVYIPKTSILTSFTIDGKIYENPETVTLESGEEYYLVRVNLPASEAARNIVLKVVLTIGGTDYNGTFTMSVLKYSNKVLSSDASETEKTLVKDVLAYIRAAYTYFEKGATPEIDAILGDYKGTLTVEGETALPTEGIAGATLVLNATPTIRFFIPEGADVSTYTFKQGGRGLEYTIGTAEAEGKTYTTVDISVYAYRMCDTITCYINGVASGTYHINAYYEFAKNDADLKAIVEAFWTYCQSARAYKASVATVEN